LTTSRRKSAPPSAKRRFDRSFQFCQIGDDVRAVLRVIEFEKHLGAGGTSALGLLSQRSSVAGSQVSPESFSAAE
jgi:uncharacterized protein (DUF169 family)